MLQVSNATKIAFLSAFIPTFDRGIIRVFSGVQPPSANYAETGTLLGTITRLGYPPSMGDYAGLRFEQQGPYIINGADPWTLRVRASGAAGWWRLVASNDDDGLQRYDLPRIDGAITEAPPGTGQLILPETTLTEGSIITPISFLYTIPPINI